MTSTNRTEPFCDYLSLTTPADVMPIMRESLDDFFMAFPVERESEACYRSESRGTVLIGERNQVAWLSASGSFLSDLRVHGLLNNFLHSLMSHPEAGYLPHRVTRLDLTVDELSYPPDKLDAFYKLGVSGGLYLTRKAVRPTAMKRIYSPIAYDDSGRDTGTVYAGHRATSKVMLTMYDKSQERAVKGVKIAPTTRYELRVTGDMSISLKDASMPAPCFYNFVPSTVLTKPFVTAWKGSSEGYVLERKDRLPSVRLKARMERSTELQALLKQASTLGPHGIDYFISQARKLYEKTVANPPSLAAPHSQ